MNRPTLSKKQIHDLAFENRYKVNPKQKFLSRCIDGRYPNDETTHPLAIAGADAGELAILYATANIYGFDINVEKAYGTFLEIIGGPEHFSSHTDTRTKDTVVAAGCGHMSQIRSDAKAYSLDQSQIEIINKQVSDAHKKGGTEIILKGDHQEGAVLQVQGEWAVHPQFFVSTAQGTVPVQTFVFHKTLVDARHRVLAENLVENKAVKLFNDLDAEYLYEVISSVTEDHLFETAKRLAKGLPIYDVIFETDGTFTIEDRGFV